MAPAILEYVDAEHKSLGVLKKTPVEFVDVVRRKDEGGGTARKESHHG
jgi:hypothetical protein